MKVVDSYWYTPTAPGFDPLMHGLLELSNVAIAFVAVETGRENTWKCYIGWAPYVLSDDAANAKMEDRIADSGAKVQKEVACAHFPQLDPTKFVY